jgi:hypothetical protein
MVKFESSNCSFRRCSGPMQILKKATSWIEIWLHKENRRNSLHDLSFYKMLVVQYLVYYYIYNSKYFTVRKKEQRENITRLPNRRIKKIEVEEMGV